MNIDDIISREQFLLEKKDNLYLEQVNTKDELKEIERAIDNIDFEKRIYKRYRNEILSKYIINVLQVAGTGALVDAPIHLIQNNFNDIIVADYIILGCVAFATTLLTIDYIYEIRNYKKNNYLCLRELEEKKENLTQKLEKNEIKIHTTMNELDSVYNSLVPEDVKVKKKSH